MTTRLTLFYDGYCPLCVAEMNKLKHYDSNEWLAFVDIQSPLFSESYPNLSWQQLNDRIHGMLPDGRLVSGLDVTYLAWKLVGKGWVYAPLRWPLLARVADLAYNVFAKHRYRISFLLTGKKRLSPPSVCETCNTKRT